MPKQEIQDSLNSSDSNSAAKGGGPSCPDDEYTLVEVAEVLDFKGSQKVLPVTNSRKQYINLDEDVDPTTAHPEYGRRIRLKARIDWVSKAKSGSSLAGKNVYWACNAPGTNKSGLTGKELEGFDAFGSGTKHKQTQTAADGWTPIVDFYPSLYGGDVFAINATLDSSYKGGKLLGTYEVWRKFWYQVTEMEDGSGSGSVLGLPAPVTSAFEAGYQTVFMEFHEVSPRNKAAYVANLADGTARANAAKPHFTVDSKVPFKAHIMTVDYSETGSEQKSVSDTLTSPKWN